MKRWYTLLLSIPLLSGCFQSGLSGGNPGNINDEDLISPITKPALCGQGETATLVKVIDGDTIDAQLDDGTRERIRLIGIDTPERGESCYAEATARLRDLLADSKNIHLIKDRSNRDKYDRLVRYLCSEEGIFIEAQLVAEGLAVPYRYYPDTSQADYLQSLGSEASDQHRGCLYQEAMQKSDPTGTSCCRVCRSGKACGDSCIPHDVTCRLRPGCACQG